ncbi:MULTISPECIES: hypothetical protein [Kitasatospora]|uniref:Ig-like domain-containing protein n=1 Tax=Kitasatospora setae (strain ATCC 33774 / DSM 43861 / JCM 3304 / KCC A-0304 / NBRC 14216 / KM-6054) TaxID=452652 RepID=E4MYZ7_KITSK|nr:MULTISPECIES: hypothetical protein [Kitasatospora]BAJ25890.1 hypothetical protein KSE_00380t [Kitasatospora setae KM-6054]BAJ33388.1 hypothetical protein KSE_76360t [Kitasatospora setae KM-6054]
MDPRSPVPPRLRGRRPRRPPNALPLLLALLLAAAALVLPAPPARAAGSLLDCPGTATSTYAPPLTAAGAPTTITLSEVLTPCAAPGTAVTSGTASLVVPVPTPYPCGQLAGSGTLTRTITWNTGQTSTLTGTYTATFVGATIVGNGSGTVVSGLFAGQPFTDVRVTPSEQVLRCEAALATVSGTVAVTDLLIG